MNVSVPAVQQVVARLFRDEARHIRAGLLRQVQDLAIVDDAIGAAIEEALRRWPDDGIPQAPGAWITVVARRRAIDQLRQRRRHTVLPDDDAGVGDVDGADPDGFVDSTSAVDEELGLLFATCHPVLPEAERVALTLQAVGGLTAEEVARAFLVPLTTMEKRLARAKTKLRRARVSFEVPDGDALPERLEPVLAAIYLIFNEGYLASRGDSLLRLGLCDDGLRLARRLRQALPHPEVDGLLALLLLTHARRDARVDADGALVLLEHQDRSLWHRAAIAEGEALLDGVLQQGRPGPYQIQAAIAALHATAPSTSATDWAQIAALYAGLIRHVPSPVVRLNHAVAVAMAHGVDAGLSLVEILGREGQLDRYHLYWSTRAELMLRRGDVGAARRAFQRARNLAKQPAEKAFLAGRIAALPVS